MKRIVTEQKVKVGEYNINYVRSYIEGANITKTLLCLPGALGSAWTDFKGQIEALPALLPELQVIAWDPPNQGKTTPETILAVNYVENEADYAYALMKTLEIPKYSLLGWSKGGMNALIMGGKYPECIDKVIVFGTRVFITKQGMKILDQSRDITKWAPSLRKPKEMIYGLEYMERKYGEGVDNLKKIYKDHDGDICKEFTKKVTAKTLVLHGGADWLISEDQIKYLQNTIPDVKRIDIQSGGHDLQYQYPNEFNKHVIDFLRE